MWDSAAGYKMFLWWSPEREVLEFLQWSLSVSLLARRFLSLLVSLRWGCDSRSLCSLCLGRQQPRHTPSNIDRRSVAANGRTLEFMSSFPARSLFLSTDISSRLHAVLIWASLAIARSLTLLHFRNIYFPVWKDSNFIKDAAARWAQSFPQPTMCRCSFCPLSFTFQAQLLFFLFFF